MNMRKNLMGTSPLSGIFENILNALEANKILPVLSKNTPKIRKKYASVLLQLF